ncbi:hypothetical protein [Pontibacter ruber]|uniref:Uncharacterized protein n=1 Tax=Pontibacter ruber TaxID=1343895 RepID=A0ABW5CV30_9BACT|nr:hypothetical protein [Pontibacter ruber]
MATMRLLNEEQYLIQTVDKKLALTTHRVIQRKRLRHLRGCTSIMLEDIESWQIKATGNMWYMGLSVASLPFIYLNDSWAFLGAFFLLLFLMTRQNRIHIISQNAVIVLPLEVDETGLNSLVEIFRQAIKVRMERLEQQLPEKVAA